MSELNTNFSLITEGAVLDGEIDNLSTKNSRAFVKSPKGKLNIGGIENRVTKSTAPWPTPRALSTTRTISSRPARAAAWRASARCRTRWARACIRLRRPTDASCRHRLSRYMTTAVLTLAYNTLHAAAHRP